MGQISDALLRKHVVPVLTQIDFSVNLLANNSVEYIILVLNQLESKIISPVLKLHRLAIGKPSEVMMTMATLTANHTSPRHPPHDQRTSPSRPQTGRGRPQQHPTLGATTTKITNPQNSYVEGLPRPPLTIPTMPPSLILLTMMTAIHNQSPQHPTTPWYKSGKSSVPSSTTSSLNLQNSMQNMTTQTRLKKMLPAPSLPAASMTTMTEW